MTENEKNYFFWNEEAFRQAVKEHVCLHCPYAGFDCKNPDPRGCAVLRYLPDLVRIAQHMDAPDPDRYREEVGRQVFFHCERENFPYPCKLLDSLHCGLDALLPHLLEAVTKTDKTLEARPDFRP